MGRSQRDQCGDASRREAHRSGWAPMWRCSMIPLSVRPPDFAARSASNARQATGPDRPSMRTHGASSTARAAGTGRPTPQDLRQRCPGLGQWRLSVCHRLDAVPAGDPV